MADSLLEELKKRRLAEAAGLRKMVNGSGSLLGGEEYIRKNEQIDQLEKQIGDIEVPSPPERQSKDPKGDKKVQNLLRNLEGEYGSEPVAKELKERMLKHLEKNPKAISDRKMNRLIIDILKEVREALTNRSAVN